MSACILRSGVSVLFGLIISFSAASQTKCPPGPFSCIPWDGGDGTNIPTPQPTPPGPFHPKSVWTITPDPKKTNKSLEELLEVHKDIQVLPQSGFEELSKEMGGFSGIKLEAGRHYYLERPNVGGIVFRAQ